MEEAKKYKNVDDFINSFSFERGSKFGMNITPGEAGTGVYAYVPNKAMKTYYTQAGEDLIKIKPKEGTIVIDLTKELDALVSFVRKEVHEFSQARKMEFYIEPQVNRQNVQRFPIQIQRYIRNNYPNASAYIVPHFGPNLPTGKQVVIIKPENFISGTKSQLVNSYNQYIKQQ